jgi:hypothetical protein
MKVYHIDKVFHAEYQEYWDTWQLYTDLAPEEIESVDGVHRWRRDDGKSISIDKRYNADEVLLELQQRSIKKAIVEGCGCEKCKGLRKVLDCDCDVQVELHRSCHFEPCESKVKVVIHPVCKANDAGKPIHCCISLSSLRELEALIWDVKSEIQRAKGWSFTGPLTKAREYLNSALKVLAEVK